LGRENTALKKARSRLVGLGPATSTAASKLAVSRRLKLR